MLLQRESKFEGSVLGFIGYGLILVILTICTFGIAYPWGEVMFRRWICRNTIIDGQRLTFDGTGLQLFGSYIKWWFFTIITLGIYGFWLFNKMTAWRVKHTHFREIITTSKTGGLLRPYKGLTPVVAL
jgi:uncharacterized membrane protein YjgN (DUF898 family)|nr:MAG TPA: protein of unknown function (DUF898) [Caudoviricetes sp.]